MWFHQVLTVSGEKEQHLMPVINFEHFVWPLTFTQILCTSNNLNKPMQFTKLRTFCRIIPQICRNFIQFWITPEKSSGIKTLLLKLLLNIKNNQTKDRSSKAKTPSIIQVLLFLSLGMKNFDCAMGYHWYIDSWEPWNNNFAIIYVAKTTM